MPGPLGDDRGDVLVGDLLLQVALLLLHLRERRAELLELLLELGDLAVVDLGRLAEIARALSRSSSSAQLLDLRLQLADLGDELLLAHPLRPHRVALGLRARRSRACTSSRRALLALSLSRFSACSSIWSLRSSRSHLVDRPSGRLSISIRIFDAASSTRSIALSGRKRSVM